MTLTAILVTHANEAGARAMLDDLLFGQSVPPDEVICVCTETPADVIDSLRADYDPLALFDTIDEVGDWGHAKRARGLELASGEWIAFFNDDDRYDSSYLARMLEAAADDVDAVYCAWNENPHCDFVKYQSTAGNFIVRTELARRIGWTGRHYEADGDFIDALVAAGARITKVDSLLYHHNAR